MIMEINLVVLIVESMLVLLVMVRYGLNHLVLLLVVIILK